MGGDEAVQQVALVIEEPGTADQHGGDGVAFLQHYLAAGLAFQPRYPGLGAGEHCLHRTRPGKD
jgi:hypothetical protein